MPSSLFSSSSSLPLFSHASRDASFLLKTRQWSEVPGHPALQRAVVAAGSLARARARTAAARGLARPRSRGGGVAARSPRPSARGNGASAFLLACARAAAWQFARPHAHSWTPACSWRPRTPARPAWQVVLQENWSCRPRAPSWCTSSLRSKRGRWCCRLSPHSFGSSEALLRWSEMARSRQPPPSCAPASFTTRGDAGRAQPRPRAGEGPAWPRWAALPALRVGIGAV